MDVRGPADGQDVPRNVSPTRRELLRDELTAAASPKSSALSDGQQDFAPEIPRLVQQLRALPEVRAELVAAAARKLKAGHYSTRESAEKTAEAILRTLTKD